MVAKTRDRGNVLTANGHKGTFWNDENILFLDLVMII